MTAYCNVLLHGAYNSGSFYEDNQFRDYSISLVSLFDFMVRLALQTAEACAEWSTATSLGQGEECIVVTGTVSVDAMLLFVLTLPMGLR